MSPEGLSNSDATVESLLNQSWLNEPSSKRVFCALAKEGATPRFVGGCVRDGLLGKSSTDLDIAIDQTPNANMRLLQNAGVQVIPTGLKHGTITAMAHSQRFEITTLRVDVETFGRHANVAFTKNWVADAARRDFTINAIYVDGRGDLLDLVGGIADLKAGRIKFVGKAAKRIEEDKLRILRYFRFQAQFGRTKPDQEALEACSESAAFITDLSGERICDEFLKILALPLPKVPLSLMADSGVLQQILPSGFDLSGLDRTDDNPVRRLATIATSGAKALAQRLCLSNRQSERLQFLMMPPPQFRPGLPRAELRRLLYDFGSTAIGDLALQQGDFETAAKVDALVPPPFPLSGSDVISAGVPPGPEIGKLLRAVEDEWRNDDFSADYDELLQILRTKLA